MADATNITVYGQETYFNENSFFYKSLNVYGSSYFGAPANFADDVYIQYGASVGVLTVRNNLNVQGLGIFETKVGIGSLFPQQRLDISGSVKIDAEIYDATNSPGPIGGFLTKDVNGIKWTALEPSFTEGIFVYNEGVLLGPSSVRGLNLKTGRSGGTSVDPVQGVYNPSNPSIADITITDYWDFNGSSIYRNSNVGINNSNPSVALDVTGSVNITGILTVGGASNLNSTLNVTGTTRLNSSLNVTGITTVNSSLNVDGVATLNSSLDVDGATTLNASLDVDGNVTFNSVTESTNKDSGALIIQGGVGIEKNTNIGGILKVENIADSTNKDTGAIVVEGGVGIEKNLNVGGSFNFGGNGSISGSLGIGGSVFIDDYLTVNDGLRVYDGLYVLTGLSTFSNSVGVGGAFLTLGNSYLTGITTIASSFNVFGQAVLNNNLLVFGTTNLFNDLYVDAFSQFTQNVVITSATQSTNVDNGALVIDGGVGIERNLNVGGLFTVSGSSILNNLLVNGDTTLAGSLGVGGNSILAGTLRVDNNVDFNANLNVDGFVTFNNDLTVFGGVDFYNDLYVQNNITAGNDLAVFGTGYFEGSTFINNDLTVTGPAYINGSLDVNNVANFNSVLNVNQSANINSNINVAGLSTFVGVATFNTDVYIGGDLYIQDDLIFDEFEARNITVTGISSLNVVKNNTLNVSGITTLQTRVNVGTGGTIITVDQFGRTGFGTLTPTRDVDFNKDVRFRQAIHDVNDSVGYKTDLYQVPRSVLTSIPVGPNGENISGRFFDAANLIRLNLDFIAEEAVGYIISNDYKSSPTFTLSSGNYTSCKDDIKDILRSITIDMTKGGNVQSIGAGLSYYNGNTLIHINGNDVNGYSIKEASIAAIGAAATVARYVINNSAPPKSYQPRPISGTNADAGRLIKLNKDFIAAEAVDRTKAAYPSLVIPGGNQNCIDDIKLILDAIIWNIQFGGNDRVFDAANFYISNPTLLSGEEVESIYAYQSARDVAIQIIRNETVTKNSGILNTFTQYKDLTILADPIVPTCQNQASAITSFVGIVTNAIGIGSLPANRTVGVASIRQIKDLTLQDDPNYNSNMNPSGCSNVASAIHTYAGIVTTIIGRGPAFAPNTTEPDGKVIWAPPGADSKNTIWVTKYGSDDNGGRTEGDAKLTIAAAVAIAEPGDTIFVRPGIYYENNPIGLRRDVAISGQDLRLVTVIPQNLGKDLFHVRRGCLIENMNFTLETGQQNIGAAVVAFPPTPEDVQAGIAYSAISGYTAPGPADEGPTGRWRSPYVRNCTNFMDRSIGMKIDGNHATGSTLGADLKCMVLDSFTQYNEAGIGVSITNEGYAQLVSLFTIACDKAVYVTSGGQCDLTNSNSSFGNYGLYADGLGGLQFTAELQTAVDQESDIFVFKNVSDKINNPRRPYDGQALYFKVPVNGVPIEAPFEQLESVIITNGGSGYSSGSPPNVIVRDADGTIQPKGLEGIVAEVSPTIDDTTGKITSIDVINSGRNYLSTQNIVIDIEGGGGATAVAKMSPIYYTVNSATIPTEPNGRYADAVNLIMRNRDFIAAEAVDRMLYYYNVTLGTPFSIPTGSQSCIDDVKLVLKSVAYNLQFGGNDKTYDAAFVYYTNSYLDGEEEQSIYTYQAARDIAKNIINNVTVTKQNYTAVNTFTQVFDYTIVPDPVTGSNTSPSSCADVKSAIDNLVGIVTFAIRAVSPTLPGSRTVGNTVGVSTVTLNEFVPYPVGVGVSVEMFKISRILTSGHSFEFIGAGTNINTSVPQQGGVPIKANEVVAINGAQIPYTSTDQAGNFNIGGGIQISQTTASISGRDFNRSIQAQVTPLILALS